MDTNMDTKVDTPAKERNSWVAGGWGVGIRRSQRSLGAAVGSLGCGAGGLAVAVRPALQPVVLYLS
jgi:hypothetical protein